MVSYFLPFRGSSSLHRQAVVPQARVDSGGFRPAVSPWRLRGSLRNTRLPEAVPIPVICLHRGACRVYNASQISSLLYPSLPSGWRLSDE